MDGEKDLYFREHKSVINIHVGCFKKSNYIIEVLEASIASQYWYSLDV